MLCLCCWCHHRDSNASTRPRELVIYIDLPLLVCYYVAAKYCTCSVGCISTPADHRTYISDSDVWYSSSRLVACRSKRTGLPHRHSQQPDYVTKKAGGSRSVRAKWWLLTLRVHMHWAQLPESSAVRVGPSRSSARIVSLVLHCKTRSDQSNSPSCISRLITWCPCVLFQKSAAPVELDIFEKRLSLDCKTPPYHLDVSFIIRMGVPRDWCLPALTCDGPTRPNDNTHAPWRFVACITLSRGRGKWLR